MDILINDYINGERSLCRDEAQFSAYLFQILNGCKRVKIDSDNFTNKTYEVMQAYYMPAFLRDYFNYADSKAEFNRKLVTFANRKLRALYAGEEAQGAMLEDVDAKAVNAAEIYNLDKELDIENPGVRSWKAYQWMVKRTRISKSACTLDDECAAGYRSFAETTRHQAYRATDA